MLGSTGSLKAGLKRRSKSKKNMSETTTNALVEMSTLSGGGGGGVSTSPVPETRRSHKADPPPRRADLDAKVQLPASPLPPAAASGKPSRDPPRRATSVGMANALAMGAASPRPGGGRGGAARRQTKPRQSAVRFEKGDGGSSGKGAPKLASKEAKPDDVKLTITKDPPPPNDDDDNEEEPPSTPPADQLKPPSAPPADQLKSG